MKKITAVLIIIVMVFVVAFTAVAYANEHLARVTKSYTYSYGDQPVCGKIFVQTEETVNYFNGRTESNSYDTIMDIEEIPWYNVWTETGFEIR